MWIKVEWDTFPSNRKGKNCPNQPEFIYIYYIPTTYQIIPKKSYLCLCETNITEIQFWVLLTMCIKGQNEKNIQLQGAINGVKADGKFGRRCCENCIIGTVQ